MQALSASSYVLGLAGYDSRADEQAPGVGTALYLMTTIVPGISVLLSIAVSFFYPLTKEKMVQIQADLRARQIGKLHEDTLPEPDENSEEEL